MWLVKPSGNTPFFYHIQTYIKENIRSPHYWSFLRGIHVRPEDSPHRGPATLDMFLCKNIIMALDRLHHSAQIEIEESRVSDNFSQSDKIAHTRWVFYRVAYYSTVTRAHWRVWSSASTLFLLSFIQTYIRENIRLSCYWSFLRGVHWCPEDSPHKGPATMDITCFRMITLYIMELGRLHHSA